MISATPSPNAMLFASLNGTPQIDFSKNLQSALTAGRQMTSILGEVIALRRGPGRLTPNEYFYYRLWDNRLSHDEKLRFVGKQAQQPMHIACNDTGWYATAANKRLFDTLMAGAGLPRPELLAVTWASGRTGKCRGLQTEADISAFLADPANYPLFAKPIDGKYSIGVVSADRYDAATDQIVLQGAAPMARAALAAELDSREAGFLVQRRMAPSAKLARLFSPRLWSVRVIVLLRAGRARLHRAVAKIATGDNPADNFWRSGNMLGAIDLDAGLITRVVVGTGAEMTVDDVHPDTGRTITGTPIPDWPRLTDLVREAAGLLPGIRTQSWDIALTDAGPIPLEVNFGGDLNLSQLASGVGVLDDVYREHLRACGYRF